MPNGLPLGGPCCLQNGYSWFWCGSADWELEGLVTVPENFWVLTWFLPVMAVSYVFTMRSCVPLLFASLFVYMFVCLFVYLLRIYMSCQVLIWSSAQTRYQAQFLKVSVDVCQFGISVNITSMHVAFSKRFIVKVVQWELVIDIQLFIHDKR